MSPYPLLPINLKSSFNLPLAGFFVSKRVVEGLFEEIEKIIVRGGGREKGLDMLVV